MPVFVKNTIPLTTSKVRINADDLENPVFPACDRKYWIVDSGKVREMTADEKEEYYPTQEPTVAEQKAALLAKLTETDYQMARAFEEYISKGGTISEEAQENINKRIELRKQIKELE